jgi:class 3 adenylate cyclase/tetratricopeptide (TPR) repeat protein
MSFVAKLQRAREVLEQQGRLSDRALARELEVEGAELEELIDELVEIQQLVRREGKALVWDGARLEAGRAGAREATVGPPPRVPGAYTPKHLADKILRSKSALEGERKHVTVLFADVKGSMELAQQIDAEDWHSILDRCFQLMAESVHRFEGTVNQYTGDGIMALFGAPIAHEDHAQRACYAALSIRDGLRALTDDVRRRQGMDFSVRVGVNSGEVVVGRIGDDLRMDYTAQGHTVGLAQRMEAAAESGKPYLTDATARLVEGFFELEDRGQLAVKGVAEPVHVFALLDVGRAHTRIDRAPRGGLTRFVGREPEMAALEAAFAESDGGRGQVVGIVADAGVGKSRLVKEFLDSVRRAGAHVGVGHCPSHGTQVPLLGYFNLMRNNFDVGDRDDPATARAKITERFIRAYPALMEQDLPLICDFLGAPDLDHPLPPMAPEERQRRLRAWQSAGAQARGRQECAVLVFEDLHWVDQASEALFDSLVQTSANIRQMVLVTYRPEYTPPWISKSYYSQLPLLPLASTAMDDLLVSLLGAELAGSEIASLIRSRCGGTPFFAEELIQSLAERGTLAGERGAYRLEASAGDVPLPSTVQAVLAARIDRLSEREKAVVQTASVIGRVFAGELLEAVAPLSADEIRAALATLLEAELVYEESLHPEIEYAFKHPLTHEVAYASQLRERREAVHAAVAGALAERYPERLDEKAALMAHHWQGAGDALRAAHWHMRAASWMSTRDRPAERRHLEQARVMLLSLPDSDQRTRMLLEVYPELLNTLNRLGADAVQTAAVFEEGLALSRRAEDRRAEVRIEAMYAWLQTGLCNWEQTRAHSEAAIALADNTGDRPAQLFARMTLTRALVWTAQIREVVRMTEDLLAMGSDESVVDVEFFGWRPYLEALSLRSAALSMLGRPREGLEANTRVLELVRHRGADADMTSALADSVWTCWFLGDAERALRITEEALERAERFGAEWSRTYALTARAVAHVLACQWSAGCRDAEHALAIVEGASAALEWGPIARGHGALCEAALGRVEALDHARTAVDELRVAGTLMPQVIVMALHARVLRLVGGPEHAAELESVIAETLTVCEQSDAHGYRPLLLLERAGLARLRGDGPGMAHDLAEARRLFTAMGVTGWEDYTRSIET